MSSESTGTTVILPIGLGAAAKYDQHIFPLAFHDGPDDNVSKGSLLLSATLEEMAKIKEMGIDFSKSDSEFIFNARIKYESLLAKRAKLQDNKKTLNPFKAFLNYRAARMFHAASLTLFLQTKGKTEKMQREQKVMKTVPSAEMRAINNTAPENATIGGIAINLPGIVDDDVIRTIFDATNTIASYASDPFVDSHRILQSDEDEAMSLTDTESLLSQFEASGVNQDVRVPGTFGDVQQIDTTSPSTPQAINHIHIYNNSVVTTRSNVSGLTMNHGSRSSGASVSR